MTSPQDIHRKVHLLRMGLDTLTQQLQQMGTAIEALKAGADSETEAAAEAVVKAVNALVKIIRKQGEDKIRDAERLLAQKN